MKSLKDNRPIVLISPVYRESWEYIEDNPAAVVPLGVLSIGTVLSEKGYKVKIIDTFANLTNLESSVVKTLSNNSENCQSIKCQYRG